MTLCNTEHLGIIIVDPEDADLDSSRWSIHSTGYAKRGAYFANGVKKEVRLHRIIAGRMIGRPLKKGEEVDHINGMVLDNRRDNLRVCTHRENLRNQQNRRRGASGYVGVSRFHGGWRSYLVIDNQQIHAGVHQDLAEAAWMRDQWAIALHGEYARLNFEYLPITEVAASLYTALKK